MSPVPQVHGDFDVAAGADGEDRRAGEGDAHVGDAEPIGLAAFGDELQSVVLLKRAAGVEAQPGAAFAVLGEALHGADGGAKVSQGRRVDDFACLFGSLRAGLRVAVRIEAGRAAREDRFEVRACRLGPRGVENLAVVLRDRGDIERGLHPALDLEGGDTRVAELFKPVVESQVAHREGQRARTGGVRVGQTAAVGALAAVAGPVLLHRGEKAEAGERVAEGAVDEHLDFAAAALRNGADVLERHLAGEDDAREAELLEREDAFEVVRDELCGGMELKAGEVPADHAGDAEVLNDEAIRPQLLEEGESLGGLRHLGVVEQRVEGDVDAPGHASGARLPGEGQEVAQLRGGEIDGLGARGEGVHAEIDGVRTGLEGGEGGLEGPGRGEEFDVVHGRPTFYHIRTALSACQRPPVRV